MNLADAYLVGSYTEFLVLLPYLAKTHEERGLISMRERALGEVKRILESNMILAHVVNEIADLMTQLKKDRARVAKVAHSEKQVCQLIEAGFDYVCDYNGTKIFRKRK